MKRVFPFILLLIALPFVVQAHPGRTDSSGCHTCRTNCPNWGLDYEEYHCHASKGVPQPEEPIRSIRGEPTGTIVPAPEYKIPTQQSAPMPVVEQKIAPPTIPQPVYNSVPKLEPQPIQKAGVEIKIEENITPEVEPVHNYTKENEPVFVPHQPERKRNILIRFFSWIF